jgi:hypothetical protein
MPEKWLLARNCRGVTLRSVRRQLDLAADDN